MDLYGIMGDCFITTHGSITGNARLNMEVHVNKNSVAFDNLIGYFSRFPLQSMKRIAYAHWLKALRILKDERDKKTKKGEVKLVRAVENVKKINQYYLD